MRGWHATPAAITDPLINLQTLKRHARISGTDDDSYLQTLLIPAAIGMVERDTRWTIRPHDYTIELPAMVGCIDLPAAPFVSGQLFYLDADGEAEDSELPISHNGKLPGSVEWPWTNQPRRQRLVVRIGDTTPRAELQLLVMVLVAHWYEHREAVTADGSFSETPLAYQHLARALDPMTDAVRVAGAMQ